MKWGNYHNYLILLVSYLFILALIRTLSGCTTEPVTSQVVLIRKASWCTVQAHSAQDLLFCFAKNTSAVLGSSAI